MAHGITKGTQITRITRSFTEFYTDSLSVKLCVIRVIRVLKNSVFQEIPYSKKIIY
jgi:hypothetical protein